MCFILPSPFISVYLTASATHVHVHVYSFICVVLSFSLRKKLKMPGHLLIFLHLYHTPYVNSKQFETAILILRKKEKEKEKKQEKS